MASINTSGNELISCMQPMRWFSHAECGAWSEAGTHPSNAGPSSRDLHGPATLCGHITLLDLKRSDTFLGVTQRPWGLILESTARELPEPGDERFAGVDAGRCESPGLCC